MAENTRVIELLTDSPWRCLNREPPRNVLDVSRRYRGARRYFAMRSETRVWPASDPVGKLFHVDDPTSRSFRSPLTLGVAVVLGLTMVVTVALYVGRSHSDDSTPPANQYVEIGKVPLVSREAAVGIDASTGTFALSCDRNTERHLNADNPVIVTGQAVRRAPHARVRGQQSRPTRTPPTTVLAAAAPTCDNGDLSSYFWPVLRLTDVTGHDAHAAGRRSARQHRRGATAVLESA